MQQKNNHNYHLFLISIIGFLVLINACKTTQKTSSTHVAAGEAVVSYSKQISTIVKNNCAISGCHVKGFDEGDFTSFDVLKHEADRGKLKRLVVDNKSMPPDKPLSAKEIKLIETWIAQGAANN